MINDFVLPYYLDVAMFFYNVIVLVDVSAKTSLSG